MKVSVGQRDFEGQHLHDGLLHSRVGRHAEVVVRAPDGDGLLAPRVLVGLGEVLGIAQHALEHAVRVVLLLLHNLLVKEVLVREETC